MIHVQKGVKVPRQLLCRALSHGGGALEVEDHEGYIHRSIVPTKVSTTGPLCKYRGESLYFCPHICHLQAHTFL